MPENPYNEVPYPSFPRVAAHPDRLAAVATLFGMNPAPITRCQVLEIGCGGGNNLIPMACALPGSRFTGIDLAESPIAAGRRTIAALGLENISLVAADLRDLGPRYGEFDYIIAHGVYSWVPADVRDRLILACNEWLSPRGIAYVSYNVYPGRHVNQMLREMMLYHTRNAPNPLQRLEQTRWFLKFLLEGHLLPPHWRSLVEHEVTALLERSPGFVFHDEIAEISDACYFWQFVEHAARHRLQYLGEADPYEMFDSQGSLTWLGDDVLEREQYLDFLRARRFRQTLLCRAEIPLRRPASPESMQPLLFSAPATPVEGGEVQGLRGIRITAAHEAVHRVASALGETYPLPLAFDELVPYAGDRTTLQEILFGLVTGGFADIHVFDFPCEETVTVKPRASRLVRHQAAESGLVTNACHRVVELDDMGRQLVLMMDGTRDHEQLAQTLAAIPGAPDLERIREHLPASMEWLASMALLEA